MEVRSAQILLAEDDPLVRDVIKIGLARRREWQVEEAANGREVVEKWRHGAFDVVLMDLQMPEIDGLVVTRLIRDSEAETGKHTAIIGFTAQVEEETLEDSINAGMDYVLCKPLYLDDLYAAIDHCLLD